LWLAGVAVRFPHSWDDNGIRLRVVGETVETSRGAVVPLAHCRRILALCRAGKEYVHNGHTEHVGQFRVDHIDVEGNVMAGCHFIPRAEIDRIAALLQW